MSRVDTGNSMSSESSGGTQKTTTRPYPPACHVLGIETSCDDTGVAILRQDGKILSNCVHSQLERHLKHGGIIPMVAKEYHVNNIDRVARQAFAESGLSSVGRDISAIAVTTRPGLDYSLQVGLNYARQLAKKYSKPLIPIHHMQAHALMPLLENRSIKFPFLTLLVSGGHCLLAFAERYNKFHLVGESLDNAPGELLDKVARRCRLRNLGDPFDKISGGAAVELLAERPNADRYKYFNDDKSVPMLKLRSCNFSFSGYLGNFDRYVPVIDDLWARGDRDMLLDELGHLCGSLQRAILAQIFRKLQRAMLYYRMHWRYQNPNAFHSPTGQHHLGFGLKRADGLDDEWLDIVVSGGVAANSYFMDKLRSCCKSEFEADNEIRIFAPSKSLCGDNGLMIAWNGMLKWLEHMETNSLQQTNRKQEFSDLNEAIMFDPEDMDKVEAMPTSAIGTNIIKDVLMTNFKMARPKNPELRVNWPNQDHKTDAFPSL